MNYKSFTKKAYLNLNLRKQAKATFFDHFIFLKKFKHRPNTNVKVTLVIQFCKFKLNILKLKLIK